MKYRDMEFDIAATNVIEGAVTIPLPNGGIVIIPVQDATPEELELIQQIKEDAELRPAPEIVSSVSIPTTEERLASTEAAILTLMEVLG